MGEGWHPEARRALEESFPEVWNWDKEQRPLSLEQQALHIAECDRAQGEPFPVLAGDYLDRKPGSSCLGRAGARVLECPCWDTGVTDLLAIITTHCFKWQWP